jgi:hypothetical protein
MLFHMMTSSGSNPGEKRKGSPNCTETFLKICTKLNIALPEIDVNPSNIATQHVLCPCFYLHHFPLHTRVEACTIPGIPPHPVPSHNTTEKKTRSVFYLIADWGLPPPKLEAGLLARKSCSSI